MTRSRDSASSGHGPGKWSSKDGHPSGSRLGSSFIRPLFYSVVGGLLFMAGILLGWPISPLGIAFLGLALHRQGDLRSAILGLMFGCVAYGTGLSWAWDSLHQLTNASALSTSAAAGFVTLLHASGYALLAYLYSRCRARGWSVPASLVVAVVAAETMVLFLEPIHLGYCLIDVEPLNQLAALGGPLALSTVGAAVAGILVSFILRSKHPRERRATRITIWTLGAAVAVSTLQLVLVLNPTGEPIPIAVMHLGQAAPEREPSDAPGAAKLREYQRVISRARAKMSRETRLLVLPESLFPQMLRDSDERITVFESAGDVPVLLGGRVLDRERRQYNAAVLLGAHGDVKGRYLKRRLFPLGEYIPAEATFPSLRTRFPTAGKLHPGPEQQPPVRLDAQMSLGVLICVEDLIPSLVRSYSSASVLVSISNDTSFSSPLAGRLHSRLARLRSIESRRDLIRSSRGGISGIVDQRGRWRVQANTTEDRLVHGHIFANHDATPYSRLGGWPGWLAIAFLAYGWLCRPSRR